MKIKLKGFTVLLLCVLLLAGCRPGPAAETQVSDTAAMTGHVTETPETEKATDPVTTEVPETEAPQTEEQTQPPEEKTGQLKYRFASKEEGVELLMSNTEYYAGFSQNDLDYKCQRKGATMEEYLAFAKEQVRDFTEGDIELVGRYMAKMEQTLADKGYVLPPHEEIVFVKTTMKEESGAGGYTHGGQIYACDWILQAGVDGEEYILNYLDYFFWHELFHCLTRANPDFRAAMYEIIHFTVTDTDFPLPPSAFENHISNPDVEHHNSYASFKINGEMIDCFVDLITTKHFENVGDSFFNCMTAGIIPIDGSDVYYLPEQAENFYDIFGRNTGYTVDPEECMADNFAYALMYGTENAKDNGIEDVYILEAVLNYLSNTVKQ